MSKYQRIFFKIENIFIKKIKETTFNLMKSFVIKEIFAQKIFSF